MKFLLLYIPFLFITSMLNVKDRQKEYSIYSAQTHDVVSLLKNGFYWVGDSTTSDKTVKRNLNKLNKSYLLKDKVFISLKEVTSVEVSTKIQNGQPRDILTIGLNSEASKKMALIESDFNEKLELALVLNNQLVNVSQFFTPFKGNKMSIAGKGYSKADFIEIKKTMDELILKNK